MKLLTLGIPGGWNNEGFHFLCAILMFYNIHVYSSKKTIDISILKFNQLILMMTDGII